MRSVLLAVVVLAVVGGLISIKGAQFGLLEENDRAAAQAGPPPESVAVRPAERRAIPLVLEAVGTLRAARGVVVSNISAGLLRELRFESGQRVEAGQVLARLDTSVERARLGEAVASRRLAEQTLARTQPLREGGAVSSSRVDTDEAQLAQATARVGALRAEIALKTIRAPFAGRLGIRQVDLGQYLPPGTPLVTLEAENELVVDFTLPQEALPSLQEGTAVALHLPGIEAPIEGRLEAISPRLNSTTRSVALRASVQSAPGLYAGMFVQVRLPTVEEEHVLVPTTALMRSAYGDRVFQVEERDGALYARERFVTRGRAHGDFTAIADGIEEGARVVYAGAFQPYEGAPVVLDEGQNPQPALAPTPADN